MGALSQRHLDCWLSALEAGGRLKLKLQTSYLVPVRKVGGSIHL